MPTVTATTTQDVKITGQVRAKLMKKLKLYEQLSAQKKAIKLAMKKQNDEIDEIRAELGQQTVKLEGFTITEVAGIRRVFNKKDFVSLGGDLKIYEEAFDEKPNKAYCKITLPGQKDAPEEEE